MSSEPMFSERARGGFGSLRPSIWRLDFVLLGAAVTLVGFSIFVLAGATKNDIPGDPTFYLTRQIIYAAVGILLCLGLARFDYSRFRELKAGLYTVMIVSIIAVLAVGAAARGSRRWIEMPFFRFQPSELAKILLVLALAAFILDRGRRRSEREHTSRIVLLGIVPAMLVMLQPDLGTASVFIAITLALLFVAGTKWTHFAALGGIAAAAVALVLVVLPIFGVSLLHGYQTQRLTSFVHPSSDPGGAGYQSNQAIIATASGQRTGRGAENATQTRLDFLPEHQTDFIFAVVSETYGFAGAIFVLALYGLIVWRALRIVTQAKNLYGALIAGGIAAMLIFQVFVNVGMSLGIMPITGVPLPLMSYGGSSVIVTFLAIGLLESVYVQSRQTALAKSRAAIA